MLLCNCKICILPQHTDQVNIYSVLAKNIAWFFVLINSHYWLDLTKTPALLVCDFEWWFEYKDQKKFRIAEKAQGDEDDTL